VRNHIGAIAVSIVAIFGAALVPMSAAAGANATSNDFAGYRATSPSAFGSASVEFRVPTVQCNGGTLAFFGSFLTDLWPEEAAVDGVCDPEPYYVGLIGGHETSFIPRPGDLVKTTVSVSSTANKATLTDVTQHRSESTSFASSPGPTVAYDGVSTHFCYRSCSFSSVVNFGKVRMLDATLNGVSPRTAGATAVNMQSGLTLEIATRALNTAGNAWTEVWKAS
jgi:hypothetical protein